MQKLQYATCAALLALVTGCGLGEDASSVNDLAASKREKNIALFLGAPTNLTGVHYDIRKNKALFEDQSMGFGFQVTALNQATKAQILASSREAASAVSDGGTLLWYFSGHGLESGAMFTEDQQTLQFREVAEAIKSARSKPLKRLVVVIDNCFAGTNLQGQNAIINENGANYADETARGQAGVEAAVGLLTDALAQQNGKYASQLYEQALVLVASQAYETSLDGEAGGVFSESWRETLKRLKSNPNATLGDMAKQTQESTRSNSGGHHTPAYRAFPSETILNEKLFTTGDSGNVTPNGGGNADGGGAGDGEPIASSTLFAALAAPDASGSGYIYISGARFIKGIKLCRGSLDTCWKQPSSEASFVVATYQPVNGMNFFMSRTPITPVAGQDFTILAYDASNKLVEARTIRFQAR